MKWLKLTALTFLATSFVLTSCKQEENLILHDYVGTSLVMSGAQEVPAVNTAAVGLINATYSQYTKTLNYSVYWSGLSGNATAAHIHGTGEAGVVAGVLQSFNSFPAKPTGSFNGSLLIDGVKFLEDNLLAGKYYINIHTAANGGGEIRGQLILKQL
jgi:hypothetical protein